MKNVSVDCLISIAGIRSWNGGLRCRNCFTFRFVSPSFLFIASSCPLRFSLHFLFFPLNNTTFQLFGGNMGYMSVKDENFPRAQGVLRGKPSFLSSCPLSFPNWQIDRWLDHRPRFRKVPSGDPRALQEAGGLACRTQCSQAASVLRRVAVQRALSMPIHVCSLWQAARLLSCRLGRE